MLELKNKKILLFGYYGKSNIGDDIMLSNIIGLFLKKGVKKISVIVDKSFNENEFSNSKIVFFKGIKKNILKVIVCLTKYDYFIWGGGTCFFDNLNKRGLKELKFITAFRKIINDKNKNYFIGIGIEKIIDSRKIILEILNKTDGLILRDSVSKKNLLDLNLKIENKMDFIEVFGDMVFMKNTLNFFNVQNGLELKLKEKYITFSGHYKYKDNLKVAKHTSQQILETMKKNNINHLVFLPAKYDNFGDKLFHNLIIDEFKKINFKNFYVLENVNPSIFISVLKNANRHIGMRLHSLILADLLFVPNIALAYQEKILQFNNKANNIMSDWSNSPFNKSDCKQQMELVENNTFKYEAFFK